MNQGTDERPDDGLETGPDRALYALLRQAGSRPRPTAVAERQTRDAVQAHWRAGVRARRQRRWIGVAAAASVLLALVILMRPSGETAPALGPVVADVDRGQGSVTLHPAGAADGLRVGQALEAGLEGVVRLRWHSGEALRLAPGSRLRALTADVLALERGRLYLDVAPGAGSATALVVRTRLGDIRHLGTQFSAEQAAGRVRLLVREGRIAMDTAAGTLDAGRGEGLDVLADGTVRRSDVPLYGAPWAWTEAAAAPFDLDGVSIDRFLADVAREIGHTVHYADARTGDIARRETLSGRFDLPPRRALELVLQTTDLDARLEEGRIVVAPR